MTLRTQVEVPNVRRTLRRSHRANPSSLADARAGDPVKPRRPAAACCGHALPPAAGPALTAAAWSAASPAREAGIAKAEPGAPREVEPETVVEAVTPPLPVDNPDAGPSAHADAALDALRRRPSAWPDEPKPVLAPRANSVFPLAFSAARCASASAMRSKRCQAAYVPMVAGPEDMADRLATVNTVRSLARGSPVAGARAAATISHSTGTPPHLLLTPVDDLALIVPLPYPSLRGGAAARGLSHDPEVDYQQLLRDPAHGVTWMTPFFQGCGVQW